MAEPIAPRRGRRISLATPVFAGREWEYVRECLDNGWVSSVGPKVRDFERAMADYLGAREAVACVNGTSAIHLALIGAGVAPGSEVIVPALTFVGSVNPIHYCGATPVFVDIDPATLTMAPAALSALLEERYRHDSATGAWLSSAGRPLGAVLTVDLYGHPADHDALREVLAPYRVPIVEDAAEALGASCRGVPAGRLGDVAALSFNGNKVITTGGGGMVVTDDPDLARRLRHLSTQARQDPLEYSHDAVGYNYRLTNIQAALGLAQMEQLEGFLARKRELAARYRERLAGRPGVEVIGEQPWARSSFWLISILVASLAASRGTLQGVVRAMAGDEIEARPFFTPAHLHGVHGREGGPLEATERVFARGLNLPSSTDLELDEVDEVVASLVRAAGLAS